MLFHEGESLADWNSIKSDIEIFFIIVQVIPCILLFWFTIALIVRLRQNSKKRKQLLKEDKQRRRGDITTFM